MLSINNQPVEGIQESTPRATKLPVRAIQHDEETGYTYMAEKAFQQFSGWPSGTIKKLLKSGLVPHLTHGGKTWILIQGLFCMKCADHEGRFTLEDIESFGI